jgi:predicted SprT family Zn-dependent metalloprotease
MKPEEILRRQKQEKIKDCTCEEQWPLRDIAIDSTEWPEQATIYFCRKCGGKYVRKFKD